MTKDDKEKLTKILELMEERDGDAISLHIHGWVWFIILFIVLVLK